MKFKELEIKREGNRFQRIIKSSHFRKSMLYIFAGALIASGIFYFTEGIKMNNLVMTDFLEPVLLGAFFGFFI
ncbi:MAG: hypothetical protein ACOCUP_02305, partial [bacterium]